MSISRAFIISVVFAGFAFSLNATTFVVPADRELIRRADAIVIGSPLTSYSQLNAAGGIETVTPFSVSEVINGMSAAGMINVVEPGGTYGDRTTGIAGVPQFTPGERLMLFLKRTGSDRWAVEELVLGKFRFATDTRDRQLLVRDADEIVGWDPQLRVYRERIRAAAPFLRFVRSEAMGITSAEQYFVADPAPLRALRPAATSATPHSDAVAAAAFTATSYTMIVSGSLGSRWAVFPNPVSFFTGTTTEPGAPGGGTTAAQIALAAWSNDCPSNVNYVYAGTDNGTHNQGLHAADGANTILFERDLSAWGIAPFTCPSGTLGIGGISSASGSNTVNGETFVTTGEADVEMNQGIANCTTLFNSGDFNSALTHEIGHTLGFRHSDQNRSSNGACTSDPSLECSNQAIMKSFIPNGLNAALQPWDLNAERLVYPGGTCNTGPVKRADFDGNGNSDIFWRNMSTGQNSFWYVTSGGFAGGATPPSQNLSSTLVGTGDFNHDGRADMLWRNFGSGSNEIWLMNGGTRLALTPLPTVSTIFAVTGIGDFDGNGYADIFWRNTQTGENSVWLFTATGFTSAVSLPAVPQQSLKIISVADLSGDGRADVLWRNTSTGDVYTWVLNTSGQIVGGGYLGTIPLNQSLLGTGDFNGDGTFDLLWRDTQTGRVTVWFIHNALFTGGGWDFGNVTLAEQIAGVGDFNGDGTYDLLWRNEGTGANSIWFITPTGGFTGGVTLPSVAGTTQKIVSPTLG